MENMKLRTMDDVQLDGKRVLVRVDFNVSLGENGKVDEHEDYRIESALPTIQELRQRRCRVIILTHLGRPSGEHQSGELKPIQRCLADLIGDEVRLLPDLYGPSVETVLSAIDPGSVVMLPNVRHDDREMQINERFGREIAQHAEVYINEAFSNSHRAHTSMVVLPQLLQGVAGRRTVVEVDRLSKLKATPEHPYVAIVSGAKITTKVGMLRQLLEKVDHLCVGGQIANVFIAAQGHWSQDHFHPDEIAAAKALLASASDKLVIPVDVVIGDSSGTKDTIQTVDVVDIPAQAQGLWDIGPMSVQNILNVVEGAKMVMWNGPVGKFETDAYAAGTKMLATRLAQSDAYRVVGGGDTVNALEEYRVVSLFDHVSVGGGAMIAFLEGKRMPGLEPLYASV